MVTATSCTKGQGKTAVASRCLGTEIKRWPVQRLSMLEGKKIMPIHVGVLIKCVFFLKI